MTRALFAIAVVLGATGCPNTLYSDRGGNSYVVQQGTRWVIGGQVGALHPAIIEYVFGSYDAPWAHYYDTLLQTDQSNKDMAQLRPAAERIAGPGVAPTGQHYARARGRMLAPYINQALRIGEDGTAGAIIQCCKTVDRDTHTLDKEPVFAGLVGNARSQVVRVKWTDGQTTRDLSWDLTMVAQAFEPEASLDYATVASSIRPLHPPQPRYE